MDPYLLGRKYDRIASCWEEELRDSDYGLAQVGRAASVSPRGTALDVGCGAGGRVIRALEAAGYSVVGLDVSTEMIAIARRTHPDVTFHRASITEWTTDERFALIVAWDSIFHLPIADQEPVVRKLCGLLIPGGILIYTFGDAVGEHESEWHGDTFHYSSIGIEENLRVIREAGCEVRHLELDQHPEKHVYVIVRRPDDDAS